jgi:hypothetical protein
LLLDFRSHLLIRDRCEIIVVHSHVILGGIKILESSGVYSRVALSGVDMAEKLPYVLVTAFEA